MPASGGRDPRADRGAGRPLQAPGHGRRRSSRALLELVSGDEHAPTTVTAPGRMHRRAPRRFARRPRTRRRARGARDRRPRLGRRLSRPAARDRAPGRARQARREQRAASARSSPRRSRRAAIENAEVVQTRAETWPEGVGASTSSPPGRSRRSRSSPSTRHRCWRSAGSLVAWRGQRDPVVEAAAARAAAELGLDPAEPRPVTPFAGAKHRHLHVMSKVRETPSRFPRRAGMARKRPLGQRFAPPSDRRQR